MKILAIGDTADNIFTLKKFFKKSKIHLITFPRKGDALFTYSEEGVEFFDTLLISKQVKKIRSIKDNFDLCFVIGWAAARVAYLAGLNYIMYFVGGDITTPPFLRYQKISYLDKPVSEKKIIERWFYRKIFDKAIRWVTTSKEFHDKLIKYRKDGIRIDRVIVDNKLFNESIEPIKLEKKKFTFLSAQRFGLEKGHDIIWEAIKFCKSDFEILQMEWFIENNNEEKEINQKLIREKPDQVKFIPLVKRNELPKYYAFADAVMGQMRAGGQGAVEREAAFCKKPVICYTDPKQTVIIDGEEISPPFLPKSKDPQTLARLIDRIVDSKEFRQELVDSQYAYIQNLSEPDKVVSEWEKIFEKEFNKYRTINRKTNYLILKLENFLAFLMEEVYYKRKMREKNIEAWGELEYKRLMK